MIADPWEHAISIQPTEEKIEVSWRSSSDPKRLRIIRELRHGEETGWGDPCVLCQVDEFSKLPTGLREAYAERIKGEALCCMEK